MLALAGNIQLVLWAAVVPGLIAVALLLFGVREPERAGPPVPARLPLSRAGMRLLGRDYWIVLAIAGAMALARFSEAFLVLRASGLGLSATWIPLVLVVMNAVYMLVAWPAGHWSDRGDRRRLLVLGLRRAVAGRRGAGGFGTRCRRRWSASRCGACTWDSRRASWPRWSPTRRRVNLRGTAFGLLSLVLGLAILLASVAAGLVWDRYGPAAPFVVALLPVLVALALVLGMPRTGARVSTGGS